MKNPTETNGPPPRELPRRSGGTLASRRQRSERGRLADQADRIIAKGETPVGAGSGRPPRAKQLQAHAELRAQLGTSWQMREPETRAQADQQIAAMRRELHSRAKQPARRRL